MKNKLLSALSNRPGPFLTPLFGSANTDFVPAVLSPEEMELRQLLFLDRTNTDYYLKAYVALLNGFPDIQRYFQDTVTTYSITDFRPKGVFIIGGDLVASLSSPGFFTDPAPVGLPVSLAFRIFYEDGVNVKVADVEAGTNSFLNYTASGNDPGKTLQINWTTSFAAPFPFSGPIVLSQAWIPNARVDIITEPSRFPYQAMLGRISGNATLMTYLNNIGLLAEFSKSFNPAEQLAIALMAVALNNPAVYTILPPV